MAAQHPDSAYRAAAYATVRRLIGAGLAGLDCYDHDRFVVDAPRPLRDEGEVALDHLGAEFLRVRPFDVHVSHVECWLPWDVRLELGLEEPDAPRLVTALASRRLEEATV